MQLCVYSTHIVSLAILKILIINVVAQQGNATISFLIRKAFTNNNVRYTPTTHHNKSITKDTKVELDEPIREANHSLLPSPWLQDNPESSTVKVKLPNVEKVTVNHSDILNFNAYTVKPIKFDYAKVFAEARAIAGKEDFASPPSSEFHFHSHNTADASPRVEGLHYVPQKSNSGDSKAGGNNLFNSHKVLNDTKLWNPFVVPLELNSEKNHQPLNYETSVSFSQPNLESLPVGPSFFDQIRSSYDYPYFSPLTGTTTTSTSTTTTDYPPLTTSTSAPYFNSLTYGSTLKPYFHFPTTTEYTPTTDNPFETTTRDTDSPHNKYSLEYFSTSQLPYELDTTTYRPYVNKHPTNSYETHNSFYDPNPHTDKPYFTALTATTKRPKSKRVKIKISRPSAFKGFTEADKNLTRFKGFTNKKYKNFETKPSFPGFTADSDSATTTTESFRFQPYKLNDSPPFTRFTAEDEEDDYPFFSKLTRSTQRPRDLNQKKKHSHFDNDSGENTGSFEAKSFDDEPEPAEFEDQDENYTFREIKSFSDNFGSKPNVKLNKFSRHKVTRHDNLSTERLDRLEPTERPERSDRPNYKKKKSVAYGKYYRPSPSKYSSDSVEQPSSRSIKQRNNNKHKKSSKPKTSNGHSRGNVKFSYEDDSYQQQPDESRIISTVYNENGIVINKDLDESPSYAQLRSQMHDYRSPFQHRFQLDAITATPNSYVISEHFSRSTPLLGRISSEVDRIQTIASATATTSTVKPVAASSKPAANEVRYFQDIFSAQLSPLNLEFGHIMESPDGWEERYERKDMDTQRHQGKVRWGDKHGGFGEHFYDLNHHKTTGSDNLDTRQTRDVSTDNAPFIEPNSTEYN